MNIVLPAMGEGIIEATVNKWLVSEGAQVREDDPLVEIATDKVDTEIPSPAGGVLAEIITAEGTVVKVGETLAVIDTEIKATPDKTEKVEKEVGRIRETIEEIKQEKKEESIAAHEMKSRTPLGKFLSPLVRNIAAREGISYIELDNIAGTRMDGRITRDDILAFLVKRSGKAAGLSVSGENAVHDYVSSDKNEPQNKNEQFRSGTENVSSGPTADEIIPMDRVRKLIAEHMVMSKRVSPHVTSFIDADVTRIVNWRNSVKEKFFADEGQKLTLTPVFIDVAAKALHDFPMINVSVEGDNIIRKKNINIGMATALPDGNLIVPVIKNANEKNLTGLARAVNDLANRARKGSLKPDEITGGTFTITNFGTFNNIAGTPIINQPQAAILGTGAVRKMPAVIETAEGDVIAIRQIMILSLSYDHRIIDGALAGKFLARIKEILENYAPDLH